MNITIFAPLLFRTPVQSLSEEVQLQKERSRLDQDTVSCLVCKMRKIVARILSEDSEIMYLNVKAHFLSSQIPLAGSSRVLPSWQNKLHTWHRYDNLLSLVLTSLKQKQLNKVVMFIHDFPEHANI